MRSMLLVACICTSFLFSDLAFQTKLVNWFHPEITAAEDRGATLPGVLYQKNNQLNFDTVLKYIKVNVYGGLNPYNNAQWNNWNVSNSLSMDSLRYSDSSLSNVTSVLSSTGAVGDNSASYGSGMAPALVLRYASNSASNRTLTLSGLNVDKRYNLELYASRNIYRGNNTLFIIGKDTQSIATHNNLANAAKFTTLIPDSLGRISVGIRKTADYNYLNGFTLTEVSIDTAFNQPPAAYAGQDASISLPTDSVRLMGSSSDSDGLVASHHWSKVSGPSQYLIQNPGGIATTVRNLVVGTYTFRLTVLDNDSAQSFDEVQIIVMPAPLERKFVKVNIYGGVNPYNNGEWNNWNLGSKLTIDSLRYSDSSLSTVKAVLSFTGAISDNGTNYGSGMAPAEVLRYTSNSANNRTLTLSGLSASKYYDLEFYASRNAYSGNSTHFIIGSDTQRVATYNNLAQKASFGALHTDSLGRIVIGVRKTADFNYLNGFTLTERPDSNYSSVAKYSAGRISLQPEESVPARSNIIVYPNPVIDKYVLTLNNHYRGMIDVTWFDMSGRVVKMHRFIKDGQRFTKTLSAAGLLKGSYIVNVQMGNETASETVTKY